MAGETGLGGSATAAATTASDSDAAIAPPQDNRHGFRDYYRVLRTHRHFRYLWLAEVVDNVGSWLSYVATLELVEQFSGGSGLALSAVVLIRFLPSLALAPVCGVVADRVNRVGVLIVAAVADAGFVALLAFVRSASQQALLYVMLTLQFSAAAFYDPARKALVPVLVPASELHLATTIDSFAWSLTGAVGASVGGVVASRLGNQACFLLDACTFLIAAWCAARVPCSLGAPDAAAKLEQQQLRKQRSAVQEFELAAAAMREDEAGQGAGEHGHEGSERKEWQQQQHRRLLGQRGQPAGHSASAGNGHSPEEWLEHGGGLAADQLVGVTHVEGRHPHHQPLQPLAREPASPAGAAAAEVPVLHVDLHEDAHWAAHPKATAAAAGEVASSSHTHSGSNGSHGGGGLAAAAAAAVAEGVRAMAQGWRYITHRANRDVAALVMMKCTAALVWGAVDLLNVKFSDMPQMQWLGDASTTLGLIFAAVGLGCFVGPVVMNRFVPPHAPALRWGVAASFALFFSGFVLMTLAPNILLVLGSTMVRSMGSATLWVYSTLLMQQRVPNDMLGRMSAIEMALFTISEAASSVFGGAAFDLLHLSLHNLLLILTTAAGAMAAGWAAYAYAANRSKAEGGAGGVGSYRPVSQHDSQGSDQW